MRPGVRIGLDVGRARIGVAVCDPHGMLATPVETVARDTQGQQDIARILQIADDCQAMEIVVGQPLNLQGKSTPSTEDAVSFATVLAASFTPVRLVDERLSTVSAQGQLRAAGKKTKGTRAIIDQQAAVVILQHALDAERSLGKQPGTLVQTHTEVRADEGEASTV